VSIGERFRDLNWRDRFEKEPVKEGVTHKSNAQQGTSVSSAKATTSSASFQDNLAEIRAKYVAHTTQTPSSSPSPQDKLANLKAQSPQTTPTSSSSPSLQDKLANLKAQSPQAAQANPAPSSPTAYPSRNR
jgi:hypothetical protein